MPTEKKKTTKKISDISRPGNTPADATSRPVIIRNRPMTTDPMMSKKADATLPVDMSPDKPEEKVTRTHMVIEPLHSDVSPTTGSETVTGVPELKLPIEDLANDNMPAEDEEKLEVKKTTETGEPKDDLVAEGGAGSEKPEHNADTSVPANTPKVAESSDAEAETPDSPEEPVSDTKTEPTQAEGHDDDSEKPQTDTAPESDESPLASDGRTAPGELLPGADDPNSVDAKAARAAAERELALQKLIDEGTYYLPINAVHKKRTQRTLYVMLVLVLLTVAAGAAYLVYAGHLSLSQLKV